MARAVVMAANLIATTSFAAGPILNEEIID